MTTPFTTRLRCPCCRSEKVHKIYSKPFSTPPVSTFLLAYCAPRVTANDIQAMAGVDYTLVECDDCELIFQRHIPSDALMETLYEQWIDVEASCAKSEFGHDIHYFAGMADEVRQLVTHLGRRPSDLQLLDFGMGWGNWSRMAQAHGCRVFGMETSPTRVDYAASRGLRCIGYPEIATESFDFIHTEQVFEHLSDPAETLAYLAGRLRPGGLIKISVPNGWGVKKRLGRLDWQASRSTPDGIMPIQPLEHINCFHHDVIQRMCTNVGLKEIDLLGDTAHPVRQLKGMVKAFCRALIGGHRYIDPGSTRLYFTPDGT